jgi:hypothetical protein
VSREPQTTPIRHDRNGHAPAEDGGFEALQNILLGEHRDRVIELRQQLARLRATLNELEQEIEQLNDVERLAEKIKPSLGPAIHAAVRESSDSMIDALHPIVGRLVARAVGEAIRELARRIDEQMRTALHIKSMARRVQARVAGISDSELTLRDALPFQVLELFLIHRETGLLLSSLTQEPMPASDSDVISGMLTAIRDFTENAFGRGEEGELDEVQYGDKRILIESGRYSYMAVVIEGVEPGGFRSQVREKLLDIEQKFATELRQYDGNATRFVTIQRMLHMLMHKMTTSTSQLRQVVPLVERPPTLRLAWSVRMTLLLLGCTVLLFVWRLLVGVAIL